MEASQVVLHRTLDWTRLMRLALALVAALLITNLGLPQSITGPLVNALLILTVEWVGATQAVLVGMVTPLGAALGGILPLPLWIMLPFIALGNAAFVSVYGTLRRMHRGVALVVAALAKFALLYAAVTVLVVRPLTLVIAGQPQTVALPASIVQMMQWPQLATALVGGLLALSLLGARTLLAKRRQP